MLTEDIEIQLFRIEGKFKRAVYKMERPDSKSNLPAGRLSTDILNEAITGVTNKFVEVIAQGVHQHRDSRIAMTMGMIKDKNRDGL